MTDRTESSNGKAADFPLRDIWADRALCAVVRADTVRAQIVGGRYMLDADRLAERMLTLGLFDRKAA